MHGLIQLSLNFYFFVLSLDLIGTKMYVSLYAYTMVERQVFNYTEKKLVQNGKIRTSYSLTHFFNVSVTEI